MENLKIEGTDRAPEVDFNFENNTFALRGESYPEDITAFYGSVLDKLDEHLSSQNGATIRFDFELIYFNSSTAKVLMGLFETLDEAAENGNEVLITWTFEADDDNMEEMGEEFSEDLEHAKFEMKSIEE
ncbi:MAG: DUF1987 domain-containing protein [Rhodospirillales bacterium]|nr:DUF1987 domain-containing protein [Rhodospirillales bacterium]